MCDNGTGQHAARLLEHIAAELGVTSFAVLPPPRPGLPPLVRVMEEADDETR